MSDIKQQACWAVLGLFTLGKPANLKPRSVMINFPKFQLFQGLNRLPKQADTWDQTTQQHITWTYQNCLPTLPCALTPL